MRALLLLASVMSSPAKESHIFLSSEHRLVGKACVSLKFKTLNRSRFLSELSLGKMQQFVLSLLIEDIVNCPLDPFFFFL